MSKDWQQDIKDFHQAAGHHIGSSPSLPPEEVRLLRHTLIKEEAQELLDAIRDGNIVELADGIVDSIVVLIGTAISYGFNLQPLWDEVHKTNLAKTGGPKRSDGKSLKPKGWVPPDITRLLKEQGL